VSASSATTRVYFVLMYTTLSIMMGVPEKLFGIAPVAVGFSLGSHSQATCRRPTLVRLISSSGEYREAEVSPATYGHGTSLVSALRDVCCAAPAYIEAAAATSTTRIDARVRARGFIVVLR